MWFEIASLLLDVASGLLGGACLLRFYMRWKNLSLSNPVGRFVQALSDWLVLPLRRIVTPTARWDWAALGGAFIVELGHFALLALFAGKTSNMAWLPAMAVFGVARLAVSGLSGLLIVYVILSWTQTHSPLNYLISQLCEPVLRPLRRWISPVGGVDLSPLAALVLLQLLAIVLARAQHAVLTL